MPSSVVAGDGEHGSGEWQGGRRGRDVVVDVPVGTVVRVKQVEGEKGWLNERQREEVEKRAEYEEELLGRLGRHRLKRRQGERREEAVVEEEDHEEDSQESEELDQGHYIDNYDYGSPPASRKTSRSSSSSDYFDPEAAERLLARRSLISSVWRHHPGSTPAPEDQLAEGEEDEGDIYSGDDFQRAEERYALTERERRAAQRLGRNGASMLDRTTAEVPVAELDLSVPTSPDSPPLLLATGGSGGHGNAFFLSGHSRSPKLATRGRHGQRVEVSLELKSPADVGMVGLPNAGKSSLLQAWTGASRKGAKVGGWEFTTLSPNVGVMRLDLEGGLVGVGRGRIGEDTEEPEDEDNMAVGPSSSTTSWPSDSERRLLIADLPGLILGASDNVGLGHSFLRHAERCAALIYVVDVSSARPTPWEDIAVLKRELKQYASGLSGKIAAVVANKCDALGPREGDEEDEETIEEAREKLARLRREVHPLPVLPVSAMWRQGVEGAAAKVYDLATRRVQESGREE